MSGNVCVQPVEGWFEKQAPISGRFTNKLCAHGSADADQGDA
jgi:hypothetical protein